MTALQQQHQSEHRNEHQNESSTASPRPVPTIRTARLVLRGLRTGDEFDLFRMGSNDAVTRYLTWPTHRTVDDSRRFLQSVLNDWADLKEREQRGEDPPADITWAITLGERDRLAGTIRLTVRDPRSNRADVGYALAQPHWGNGTMTEAVQAVLDYAFGQLGLNRVEATCVWGNGASARVLQKTGMTLEGVMRQHRFMHGAYQDIKLYALLRSEWEAARQSPSSTAQQQT